MAPKSVLRLEAVVAEKRIFLWSTNSGWI